MRFLRTFAGVWVASGTGGGVQVSTRVEQSARPTLTRAAGVPHLRPKQSRPLRFQPASHCFKKTSSPPPTAPKCPILFALAEPDPPPHVMPDTCSCGTTCSCGLLAALNTSS